MVITYEAYPSPPDSQSAIPSPTRVSQSAPFPNPNLPGLPHHLPIRLPRRQAIPATQNPQRAEALQPCPHQFPLARMRIQQSPHGPTGSRFDLVEPLHGRVDAFFRTLEDAVRGDRVQAGSRLLETPIHGRSQPVLQMRRAS